MTPHPKYKTVLVCESGRIFRDSMRLRYLSKKGNEFFRVTKRKEIATQKINSGYLMVHFTNNGERKAVTVHSLVAETFLGPRPKGHDVCHIDGDKTNNTLSNLRYDTRRNNHLDKFKHGTMVIGTAKINFGVAEEIRRNPLNRKFFIEKYGITNETIRRILRGELWCPTRWKR